MDRRAPAPAPVATTSAPPTISTQIGLIPLIALGSKNAILIVEYARQRRVEVEGMETFAAAVEGGPFS